MRLISLNISIASLPPVLVRKFKLSSLSSVFSKVFCLSMKGVAKGVVAIHTKLEFSLETYLHSNMHILWGLYALCLSLGSLPV